MAIDPSIILQAGRGITPLLSPAEIQDQQMQREMGTYKLNALRQANDDDMAYRNILRSGVQPDQIVNKLYSAGLGKQAQEAQKFQTDQAKAARDAEKAKYETASKRFELIGQVLGSVKDQDSYDAGRQQLNAMGIPTPNAPPQYDPSVVQRFFQQAMSAKDQADQKWKEMEYTTPKAGAILQAQTSRANNADTVAVQRDRLTFDQNQPKGQVVQTDSGTMLVDPRTGEAKPVTSGGVPVQKPGKEIPANVNKSIIDNQQSLNKIDRAIQAITDDPKALGLQYAIPGAETIGQYIDSSGVPTRAAVADIGSLVLHDRSGAAVTVSEFPRLKPFIPTASDSPQAAIDKLKQLRKAMADEADLLAQTYSKEQGYKESPVLKSQASQQTKPNLTRKTIGGKTYENDGKGWYVVN